MPVKKSANPVATTTSKSAATLQTTLDFLRGLRDNNSKAWFDANRAQYDLARGVFTDLVMDVISKFGEVEDLAGVEPKDCIYRINRDVRFSPDKSPYKTMMSALIGKGGRKAESGWYYLHIEPDDHSFVAGGIHMPNSEQLAKIRIVIGKDSKKLKKILEDKTFTKLFGKLEGESLKKAPQGYSPDHPDIELLKLKEWTVSHPLTDAQIVDSGLIDQVVDLFSAMKPFVRYMNDILI
jgi:uncharacterized protein (TIGR02453 family)